ncbi:Auxin-responsive protein IAA33 [Cardamine amara subsp. amara]|uniref:Auxin-responsive protein n=1 Tax=Cardamine amara subsp. amara TaxID=228776 RepID=A0ABD1BJX4_CARAN
MNSFEPQSQDSLQRRFHQDNKNTTTQQPRDTTTPFMPKPISQNPSNSSAGAVGRSSFQGFGLNVEDDLVSSVVPPVTVVLEGRSICQRISLEKHGSYQSLALALRQMFVDGADSTEDLDLSNAIPGYLIAYEDMENDLLLAGDLTWKDFVRVAKRIRILPVKGNSRKVRRNE